MTSITVTGRAPRASLTSTNGIIKFNPGPGVNVVTYTNKAKAPP